MQAEPSVRTPLDVSTAAVAPPAAAFAAFPPLAARPEQVVQPGAVSAAAPVAEASDAPVAGKRRYAHGELLLAAFIAARRPLAFEDLAGVLAGTGARVSELVTWMATSQANGLIVAQEYKVDALGSAVGSRLFVLSDEAREELRARRGRRRAAVAA